MLKKQLRLPKNADFRRIINKGRKLSNNQFNLYYLPADNLKIGITCSSKLLGAVGRNKVRRQIHSFIKQTEFIKTNQLELVISVKSGYLTNDYHSNCSSLQTLLALIEENK